jgi:glycosyltransferase involved in cell wall biosynthesis
MARVSLICTIRNEAKTIGALIESIFTQTRPPDEIVIADGGSTDGTIEIVESYIARGYPIKLVDGRGNISTGRNKAARYTSGDVLITADAGLALDPRWLESLVTPVEKGVADFAGGSSTPMPQSIFEAVSGELLYPKPHQIFEKAQAGKWHFPTRNGLAFRKADWAAVGGFPEHLDHNEDTAFMRRLRKLGRHPLFVSDAMVYFRPRESLRKMYRQHYLYARGDGMGRTKLHILAVRAVVGISAALALPFLLTLFVRKPTALAVFLVGLIAWLAQQRYKMRTLFDSWTPREQLHGVLLIPAVRLIREYARLFGATAGLIESFWRRPAPSQHEEPVS